uniref:WH1 domain-containing protein n=1 Tax=Lygus hesperus TaxID=30085 RepID=A0A0A9Z533_LYGHE
MMTSGKDAMGEQPIFTCRAHVFHIDPKTKRSWIPASTSAVNVSFFYDCSRSLYRIISVEGSKFIEKFQEVKEATRATNNKAPNGNASTTPVTSANASPITSRASGGALSDAGPLLDPPSMQPSCTSPAPASSAADDVSSHLRGGSSAAPSESPKHEPFGQMKLDAKSPAPGPTSTSEQQLRHDNERLKIALASSSANAKKWEVELSTLKNNNLRLTSALQESTANVDEWKRQLHSYKEENQRLKSKYIELEAAKGGTEAAVELRKELATLRLRVETLEVELKSKDDELKRAMNSKQPSEERCKALQQENAELQASISLAQAQLDTAMAAQESQKRVMDTLNSQLLLRIQELAAIHREVATALQT